MQDDVKKIRLQEYGVNLFDFCPSKSALKKALKKKYVRVDGSVASTATYIQGGEKIELAVPFAEQPEKFLNLPLKVIFEDDYIAAVCKPAGLLTSGNKRRTLANALPFNLTTSSQIDSVIPSPTHRLDYETSGLMLIGKTKKAITELGRLFENRKIVKTYFAIAIGPMPGSGEINFAVDGKSGLTRYAVQQSVPSKRFGCLNLVQLIPETGRRNQLRVHLQALGNPILGDKKYGNPKLILNGKGLYLHAFSLVFKHPFTGQHMSLMNPLPIKYSKIFNTEMVHAT